MRLFLFLLLLLPGCAPLPGDADGDVECRPGVLSFLRCSFLGAPVVLGEEVAVANPDNRRYFLTANRVEFIDAFGARWNAPVGTATDGASIPRIFEGLIGAANSPEFREATAIHDAYCGRGNEALEVYQSRPWREVHRSFYDALIVNGVDEFRAKVMFVAVYLGGPRWGEGQEVRLASRSTASRQELEAYRDWIAQNSPSAAKLQYVMDQRDAAVSTFRAGPPTVQSLRAIAATR